MHAATTTHEVKGIWAEMKPGDVISAAVAHGPVLAPLSAPMTAPMTAPATAALTAGATAHATAPATARC